MFKGGRRMRSGRHRKPTALKVLEGTFRPDRHKDEPQIETVGTWPEPPAWLNERERALWAQLKDYCAAWTAVGDALAINGVVSLVDRLLKNQRMQEETSAKPIVVNTTTKRGVMKDADGNLIPSVEKSVTIRESPLISQEIKLWKELRAYLGLMGLSPVDRARVTVTAKEGENEGIQAFVRERERG